MLLIYKAVYVVKELNWTLMLIHFSSRLLYYFGIMVERTFHSFLLYWQLFFILNLGSNEQSTTKVYFHLTTYAQSIPEIFSLSYQYLIQLHFFLWFLFNQNRVNVEGARRMGFTTLIQPEIQHRKRIVNRLHLPHQQPIRFHLLWQRLRLLQQILHQLARHLLDFHRMEWTIKILISVLMEQHLLLLPVWIIFWANIRPLSTLPTSLWNGVLWLTTGS